MLIYLNRRSVGEKIFKSTVDTLTERTFRERKRPFLEYSKLWIWNARYTIRILENKWSPLVISNFSKNTDTHNSSTLYYIQYTPSLYTIPMCIYVGIEREADWVFFSTVLFSSLPDAFLQRGVIRATIVIMRRVKLIYHHAYTLYTINSCCILLTD